MAINNSFFLLQKQGKIRGKCITKRIICVDWQGAASGYCLWWLPWDGPGAASAKWPQTKMNTWVKLALASQKTVAPPGFAFTYHSLRAGAATAAHSIGVSERKIRTMGNWGPQSTAIDR